jgi:hypothetical protein
MIYEKFDIRIFVDFKQFFKGRRNHYTLCRLRFVFPLIVKNYGKRFLNLAPPPT